VQGLFEIFKLAHRLRLTLLGNTEAVGKRNIAKL
jgi:hypothetical protein